MINLKNLAFASLFITTSAFAQNSALKRLLINDASVGVHATSFQYVSKGSNMDFGYGVNYSKQISPVVGVQIGYINTKLSNDSDTIESNTLAVSTNFNLTNVSVGSANNILFYLSAGFQVLNYEDRSISPNFGTGAKYSLTRSLDLDLLLSLNSASLTPEAVNSFMSSSLGVSYRFTKKEVAAEWNNPLDAMYGDIATVKTEIEGLSTDSDGDGVSDAFDGDNNTPEGVAVDGKGNALDVDMDGIADYADEDPFTARGVKVDAKGRELDSDKDGVANSVDVEPNTEPGATVNFQGKEIGDSKGAFMPAVYFDFNSAKVSYANYERLAAVASLLQANPKYKLKVIGYADTVGNSENNHKIALRRANAVIDALNTMFSIDASRLSAESKGEDAPLANESVNVTETTADGQVISNNLTRMNRRVEFVIE
jgi:outer membrane protein OmpA-like peptidoglycan-associated protein